MVVLILGVKNPTIELCLWHVKYLAWSLGSRKINVMTQGGDMVMGRNFFTKYVILISIPMNYNLSILCNNCI